MKREMYRPLKNVNLDQFKDDILEFETTGTLPNDCRIETLVKEYFPHWAYNNLSNGSRNALILVMACNQIYREFYFRSLDNE